MYCTGALFFNWPEMSIL